MVEECNPTVYSSSAGTLAILMWTTFTLCIRTQVVGLLQKYPETLFIQHRKNHSHCDAIQVQNRALGFTVNSAINKNTIFATFHKLPRLQVQQCIQCTVYKGLNAYYTCVFLFQKVYADIFFNHKKPHSITYHEQNNCANLWRKSHNYCISCSFFSLQIQAFQRFQNTEQVRKLSNITNTKSKAYKHTEQINDCC